jgi:hypothetical protein
VRRLALAVLLLAPLACSAASAVEKPRPPARPTFTIPYALEYGADGALYIADGGLGRVLRYDVARKRLRVFARGLPEPAQLLRHGNVLYVSELRSNRVVRLDRLGRATTLVRVRAPAGLALRGSTVFVSSLESFIVAVDTRTGSIERIAGDGTPEATGDGGPARDAHVESPHGLAADRAGNVYLDGAGSIRRIEAATGTIETVLREPGFPCAVARDGTLYFTQGDPRFGGAVKRLLPDGRIETLVGGPNLLPTDLLLTSDERAILFGQTRPFAAVRRLDLRTRAVTTVVRGR